MLNIGSKNIDRAPYYRWERKAGNARWGEPIPSYEVLNHKRASNKQWNGEEALAHLHSIASCICSLETRFKV